MVLYTQKNKVIRVSNKDNVLDFFKTHVLGVIISFLTIPEKIKSIVLVNKYFYQQIDMNLLTSIKNQTGLNNFIEKHLNSNKVFSSSVVFMKWSFCGLYNDYCEFIKDDMELMINREMTNIFYNKIILIFFLFLIYMLFFYSFTLENGLSYEIFNHWYKKLLSRDYDIHVNYYYNCLNYHNLSFVKRFFDDVLVPIIDLQHNSVLSDGEEDEYDDTWFSLNGFGWSENVFYLGDHFGQHPVALHLYCLKFKKSIDRHHYLKPEESFYKQYMFSIYYFIYLFVLFII